MIDSAIYFRENIWKKDEYHYEAAYGFIPNIHAYLHSDETVRPCMIVVPGGGYCMVVGSEGEIVARDFYEMGMNVFVLTYTTDITMSVPLRKQPMNDLSRAIRYIRANSGRFHVDGNRLAISGFSAGGHVCASVATHYPELSDPDSELNAISNRPDAVIVGYPVITAGAFTHQYSIQALLGYTPSEEELTYYSCEKQVHSAMPPCFIWQTVEDNLVPVENSMMFAESCRKAGVPYAYYAFPRGPHGLSVPFQKMAELGTGENYTMEQVDNAVEAVRARQGIRVSEQRRTELMIQFFGNPEGVKQETKEEHHFSTGDIPSFDDVAMWQDLAKVWLRYQGILPADANPKD